QPVELEIRVQFPASSFSSTHSSMDTNDTHLRAVALELIVNLTAPAGEGSDEGEPESAERYQERSALACAVTEVEGSLSFLISMIGEACKKPEGLAVIQTETSAPRQSNQLLVVYNAVRLLCSVVGIRSLRTKVQAGLIGMGSLPGLAHTDSNALFALVDILASDYEILRYIIYARYCFIREI
ncbi:hypothetical protein KIPB_012325, partial [Kipferlia bialata]